MAYQRVWYFTDLPEKIVETIEEDVRNKFEGQLTDSRLYGGGSDKQVRDSQNAWIPTSHWLGGFIWHYIQRANRENFVYDLTGIDGEKIQYTKYNPGQFYGWHCDAGCSELYKPSGITSRDPGENATDFINTNTQMVRKLSFAMQLSHPDDYEGGNVQLIDESGKTYLIPRQRGVITLFDSRTRHRVLRVTKGVRRSAVGWVLGPRWK